MAFILASAAGAPDDRRLPIYSTELVQTGLLDYWHSPSLSPLLHVVDGGNVPLLQNRVPGGPALANASVIQSGFWRANGGPFGTPAIGMVSGGSGGTNRYLHNVAAGSIWGMLICKFPAIPASTRNLLGGRTDLTGGTHRLRIDGPGSQLRWVVGGGGTPEVTALRPVSAETWYAIVFSFDAATGTAALSVDGGMTWSTATSAGAANAATSRLLGGAIDTAGTGGTLFTDYDWCVYLGGTGYVLAETHAALRALLRAYALTRARVGLG